MTDPQTRSSTPLPPPVATSRDQIEAEPAWTWVRTVKDLGTAIRRRRKELGYGIVEASALCGVGTRFLFQLEHGKETVEFGRALAVAERFGLRLGIGLAGQAPGPKKNARIPRDVTRKTGPQDMTARRKSKADGKATGSAGAASEVKN